MSHKREYVLKVRLAEDELADLREKAGREAISSYARRVLVPGPEKIAEAESGNEAIAVESKPKAKERKPPSREELEMPKIPPEIWQILASGAIPRTVERVERVERVKRKKVARPKLCQHGFYVSSCPQCGADAPGGTE